jgi:Cof subfamily protein (haloacid dehalogenase superfamily)
MKTLPDWNSSINDLTPFSKIKVIVSDIDGTLLTSGNSHDHSKLDRLVKILRNKGINTTFATGRSYNGVKELIGKFPIAKGIPIMLYNGSVCVLPLSENILFKNTINANVLKMLVLLAKECDSTLLAYDISKQFISELPLIKESVYAWGNFYSDFTEPNGLPVEWESDCLDIFPVAILIYKDDNKKTHQELLSKVNNISEITTTKSSSCFIEIRPNGSDKGNAIEALCKHLKINSDSILAIGDNDNDVEMLKYAGISVAVRNSSKAALDAGKYLSSGSSIMGVIETLELIWQANRYISLMEESK